MPLSEHEQRMLDEIESALYAEDPKFASSVKVRRFRIPSTRRRLQAVAIVVIGLVLLIAGIALPVKPGGFPILSLFGFIAMFGGAVMLMMGGSMRRKAGGGKGESTGPAARKGGFSTRSRGKKKVSGSFSERMEDRFRRRFEQG